ncbi:hypothetical protein [Enterobacter phage SDFMU_EhYP]|uniref:Uncharacterized protein n=1 Tax=Enterobacter phage SDFMU_EhYP TaxID=3076128 RepID=A0AA96KRN0_9CAUD|nr:hypothetical protein [Enterobacter phage SDFMU_EhYP]
MYKTLDRNELFEGFAVPDWATAAARFKGHWYFEESLEQLNGSRFERVGSGCTGKYGRGTIKGFTKAVLFTPLVEQEDPLPPAPESALYVNKWRWGVGVRNLGDEVQIGTGNPNSCNHGWTYATLDPDAALQLAHDLNRMAMEIKRKEKQNA